MKKGLFLLVLILTFCLLFGCSSIEQTVLGVTIEAGSDFEFVAADFFDVDEDDVDKFEADTSSLDTSVIGEHIITVTYNEKTVYTITVTVEDTIPPSLTTSPTVVFLNDPDMLEDVIEISYEDVTDCIINITALSYISEPTAITDSELEALLEELEENEYDADYDDEEISITDEGIYLIAVSVTDEGNNSTTHYVILVYDNSAADITGLADVTVEQEDLDAEPEIFTDDITITDNFDGEILLSDAEIYLEINENSDDDSRSYTLTVAYTDRASNIAEETCTYSVILPETDTDDESSSQSDSSSSKSSNDSSSSNNSSSSNSSSSQSDSSSSDDSSSSSSDSSSDSDSSNGYYVEKVYDSSSSTEEETAYYNSSYESQVLSLINEERAAEGLDALTTNGTLTAVAEQRALELVTNFSHVRPDGTYVFSLMSEMGLSYYTAGENIAYGQSSPSSVVSAWMNSDGHRANILGEDYTSVGIGCYVYNGTYYWVQVFMG